MSHPISFFSFSLSLSLHTLLALSRSHFVCSKRASLFELSGHASAGARFFYFLFYTEAEKDAETIGASYLFSRIECLVDPHVGYTVPQYTANYFQYS